MGQVKYLTSISTNHNIAAIPTSRILSGVRCVQYVMGQAKSHRDQWICGSGYRPILFVRSVTGQVANTSGRGKNRKPGRGSNFTLNPVHYVKVRGISRLTSWRCMSVNGVSCDSGCGLYISGGGRRIVRGDSSGFAAGLSYALGTVLRAATCHICNWNDCDLA